MMRPRVLVIDDERNFREFLGEALEAEGYAVSLAATARVGLALADEQSPHIVLVDQNLPDRCGLEILPQLRSLPAAPHVIVITAFAEYPRAVEAIKAGAYHYLSKPFEFGELLAALAGACSVRSTDPGEVEPESLAAIIGSSPGIVEVKRQITRIARAPVTAVLLEGESGTGKELIAWAIHALSDRAGKRMLCVNCAAFTETLLMSELFGHDRGAFTDAREQTAGVFEAAHGGTLFLDEVSEMGSRAQAALLRVIEQQTLTRVGGTREIPIDIRIVVATNRALDRCVEAGNFRADLYYRLNVVKLRVPPLRERASDVPALADHFATSTAARYHESVRSFSAEAIELLNRYPWPGNVRELRNAVERAYVVGNGPEIAAEDLPAEIRWCRAAPPAAAIDATAALPFQEAKQRVIEQFERTFLERMLRQSRGNVSRAAEEAGMLRQVFQRLLQRHGLDAEAYRR